MARDRSLLTFALGGALALAATTGLQAQPDPGVYRFQTLMHRRPRGEHRAYRWVVRVTNQHDRALGPFPLAWDAPGAAQDKPPEGPPELPRLAPGASVTLDTARFFAVYHDLRLRVLGRRGSPIASFRKSLPIVPAQDGPPPPPDAPLEVTSLDLRDAPKVAAVPAGPVKTEAEVARAGFERAVPKFPKGIRILVGEYTAHGSNVRGLHGAKELQVRAKAANFDYEFGRDNVHLALEAEISDHTRNQLLVFDQDSGLSQPVLYLEVTRYDPEDPCNLFGRLLGVGIMPRLHGKLFFNKYLKAEVFTPIEGAPQWVEWKRAEFERLEEARSRRRGRRRR